MPERQMSLALALPKPSPAEAIVHDCIARVLPPGVPSYVHRIERVVLRDNEVTADLRVWDGALHTVRFWGFEGSGLSMRWLGPPDAIPFGWDERSKRWRRYPEDALDA